MLLLTLFKCCLEGNTPTRFISTSSSSVSVNDKQKQKYANVVRMLEFYNEVQELKDGKNNAERMNETPDEVEECLETYH